MAETRFPLDDSSWTTGGTLNRTGDTTFSIKVDMNNVGAGAISKFSRRTTSPVSPDGGAYLSIAGEDWQMGVLGLNHTLTGGPVDITNIGGRIYVDTLMYLSSNGGFGFSIYGDSGGGNGTNYGFRYIYISGDGSAGTGEIINNGGDWQPGPTLVPAGSIGMDQWVRLAFSYASDMSSINVKIWESNNLLSDTPSYSGTIGNTYPASALDPFWDFRTIYIQCPQPSSTNPQYLDDIRVSNTAWPSRAGGGSTGSVKSGLSLAY
jgi:hypothetical protein